MSGRECLGQYPPQIDLVFLKSLPFCGMLRGRDLKVLDFCALSTGPREDENGKNAL